VTDGGDLIQLHEPPAGFLTDRDVDRVLAVLDDPTQVTEAIEDLAREGFDPEEIVVLSGPEGAARLEAPDHDHCLCRKFYEHLRQELLNFRQQGLNIHSFARPVEVIQHH